MRAGIPRGPYDVKAVARPTNQKSIIIRTPSTTSVSMLFTDGSITWRSGVTCSQGSASTL